MNVGDSTRVGLPAALAAWAGDPVLAAPLADSACAFLVLDGTATRLLHASDAALPFRDAISDGAGTLASGLSGQIRAVGATARPRLARLRLDPRRIAPPTACLIAGGTLDAGPFLLLILAGPLPAFRPRHARSDPPMETVARAIPPVAAVEATPAIGDRFVWRSDASDRLTTITGPSFETLAPRLVGQSWADLAEAGRLRDAEGFISALRVRRTFRALPAALEIGTAGTLALEVSGACLGRSGDAFSGLGGYGIVRAVTAAPVPVEVRSPDRAGELDPSTDAATDHSAAEGFGEGGSHETRALPDIRAASWPPATAARLIASGSGTMDLPAQEVVAALPEPGLAAAVVPSPSAVGPLTVQEGTDAALSVTEHAAFREIARALGARYAGDDDRSPSDDADAHGSVMPFPAARAIEPERFPQPVVLALPLDDLPVAVLIHRGDAVLAANRRLLDLTGHADLASLQAAGLALLFHGLPPDRDDAGLPGSHGPRVIETAQGGSRPVLMERGPADWQGGPADCLILRSAPEADPVRERTAERLAQSFRDAHAADARGTLDALDDGVVTLDPAYRVIAMNRAAAGLFACDPREVVGTAFDTLFEPSQRDAVRAIIEGLGTETRLAAIGGRPLVLRASGRDGARVAVLRAPADETARPAPDFDRRAFFGRLDREIRTPVEGIVGLADGILAEPHGPVDERYRAPLRAIRAAGDHLRGLVSDLIDIATIEGGGRTLAVRPLPLNELVSGCVELLQPEAARGRIVLRTSFSPDLAPLEADEPSLRQAALTVIGDAIRATAAGGQVIVSTAPGEGGGVALKVRGTGPGSRSAETEGTHELRIGAETRGSGLGLPLSKALVEANHGHMRISSRGNEGMLVEILLPGPESRTA